MPVTLKPLEASNWEECAKLEVAEDQKDNLPSNLDSMNKLQSYPCSKGFVIMHDDEIVGFTTFGIQEGEEIPKIFNFMIDKKHQGKGYGKAALKLIIETMFSELDADEINVCYNPLKKELKRFYESFGFEDKEILPSDKPQGKMWAVLNHKNFKIKVKSVYIFGPIHLFGEDYLPTYKHLTSLCQKYFDKVICTYPDFWDSKETPKEFYDRTIQTITKCDLFIGEISSPSMGVGMEFQIAQEHSIPCIAICKKGIKPSIMITGIPCTKKIIYYQDLEDLSKQLEKELNK